MATLHGKQISDAKNEKRNRGGTMTKGHRPGGVCIAMTAVWLKEVFHKRNQSVQGDQSKLYRYDGVQQLAEGLFGFYRVKGDSADYFEARKKLFNAQGLQLDLANEKYDTCREVFKWISERPAPGAYSIKVPGHAVAAYIAGPKAYFYDPNEGVYEYDTAADFFTDAYIFTFFEYCDWQNEKTEVFAWPVTPS